MEKLKIVSSWMTVLSFIALYILLVWNIVNEFPYITIYVLVLFVTSLISYVISNVRKGKTK